MAKSFSPTSQTNIKSSILSKNNQCLVCERRCKIESGKYGYCKTRKNIDGRIYTTVYGILSSMSVNQIEKKPFFHFHPATHALTGGTFGCNFPCRWCQNWEITKCSREEWGGDFYSPGDFIKIALKSKCQGISISFNEPTLLFEWSLEVFRLAREKGLYNTYVTNGYMTEQALKLLIDAGLDGANFDLKGDGGVYERELHAEVEKVWRNLKICRSTGIHLEITTLIIPGINDDEEKLKEIAVRIVAELGPDIPWHLSRYFPAYKLDKPPTEVAKLSRVHDIAKRAGLRYVYLGNVPGHKYENTYCPNCSKVVIKRQGYDINNMLDDDHCPYCGTEIQIR